MLNYSPRLPFCGLTIILSNPSRFDSTQLLSGNGGGYFAECLSPDFNRWQCDIRLKEDERPFLPNTKCILLLGESALQSYSKTGTNLNAQRGNVLVSEKTGIPIIASYSPQDAVDLKDYEGEFNPLLFEGDITSSPETNNDVDEKKHAGKTSRSNYRFWLGKDIEKAKVIVQNGGILSHRYKEPFNYIIYPSAQDVCKILENTKGQHLYFDIETDANLFITCFSFSFGHPNVFVVPIISHDYSAAYSNTAKIFKALAIAISNNTLVAHNGSGFDFIVLAHKYRIPIGHKVYDTMLAQNRIYPEAEKSLGHSISLPWMFEQYHKDEGSFAYGNQQQAMQLWKYCGKDVSSLILLKEAQDEYCKKRIGLRSSIDSVNSYIRTYITISLTGLCYSQKKLDNTIKENDRLCSQYLRLLKILIGEKYIQQIRKNGKGSVASSSKQAVRYFHQLLNYPVVMTSKKTKEPSLGAKAIYKLKLKHNNPVLDVIIAYRALAKETGSLGFEPLYK